MLVVGLLVVGGWWPFADDIDEMPSSAAKMAALHVAARPEAAPYQVKRHECRFSEGGAAVAEIRILRSRWTSPPARGAGCQDGRQRRAISQPPSGCGRAGRSLPPCSTESIRSEAAVCLALGDIDLDTLHEWTLLGSCRSCSSRPRTSSEATFSMSACMLRQKRTDM